MAAEMLCEASVDVGGPSEVVACDAVAGDRQTGLEVQKVDTSTHVKQPSCRRVGWAWVKRRQAQ